MDRGVYSPQGHIVRHDLATKQQQKLEDQSEKEVNLQQKDFRQKHTLNTDLER